MNNKILIVLVLLFASALTGCVTEEEPDVEPVITLYPMELKYEKTPSNGTITSDYEDIDLIVDDMIIDGHDKFEIKSVRPTGNVFGQNVEIYVKNTIYYSTSGIKIDFYVNVTPNPVVKNLAICFVHDWSLPFDGNEINSAILYRFDDAGNVKNEYDLTDEMNNHDPFVIEKIIDTNYSERFRLSVRFNKEVCSSNDFEISTPLNRNSDTMYVYFDDNEEYLGKEWKSETGYTQDWDKAENPRYNYSLGMEPNGFKISIV